MIRKIKSNPTRVRVSRFLNSTIETICARYSLRFQTVSVHFRWGRLSRKTAVSRRLHRVRLVAIVTAKTAIKIKNKYDSMWTKHKYTRFTYVLFRASCSVPFTPDASHSTVFDLDADTTNRKNKIWPKPYNQNYNLNIITVVYDRSVRSRK